MTCILLEKELEGKEKFSKLREIDRVDDVHQMMLRECEIDSRGERTKSMFEPEVQLKQ